MKGCKHIILAIGRGLVIIIKPEEDFMKIGKLKVKLFKIRNRKGYAAICADHLTEGRSRPEAYDRMVKAIRRMQKNGR